jgi:uncharacterized protein YxjI
MLENVDFSDDSYRIEQSLIRNKYTVYDADDQEILNAKQKLFKMKEEFPFTDTDGTPVFRIKADSILDAAGDYTIYDESTDEPLAVLEKKWTLLQHTWKIRDPDDERLLAKIESRGAVVEAIRNIPYLSIVTGLIPHEYTIEDNDGEQLGTIEGQLSLRDKYDLQIEDSGDMPREALVASAIAIDALEGN